MNLPLAWCGYATAGSVHHSVDRERSPPLMRHSQRERRKSAPIDVGLISRVTRTAATMTGSDIKASHLGSVASHVWSDPGPDRCRRAGGSPIDSIATF